MKSKNWREKRGLGIEQQANRLNRLTAQLERERVEKEKVEGPGVCQSRAKTDRGSHSFSDLRFFLNLFNVCLNSDNYFILLKYLSWGYQVVMKWEMGNVLVLHAGGASRENSHRFRHQTH